MSKNKRLQKFIAIMLSIAIAMGLTPAVTMAETGGSLSDAGGEIIALEELAGEIAFQIVPPGTLLSDLNLPETLKATVRPAPETESDEAPPAEPVELTLFAAWEPEPEYNGDVGGEYIFTPVLPAGYILANGVVLPRITVGVVMEAAFSIMSDPAADYAWYDSKKTAARFEISSEAELKGLADIVNGNHGTAFDFSGKIIDLMQDIDLSVYENWTPIGANGTIFSGTFNGNHHTISNLTINTPAENIRGLFGLVQGSISNLILSNVSITGQEAVGGVAGELWGTITLCAVEGGSVTANGRIGGIAGKVEVGGSVTKCYTTCNVTGTGHSPYHAGGIVGSSYGNIANCYATGTVSPVAYSGYFDGAGGITGRVGSYGSVQNCFATGEVRGTINVGGIAGWAYGAVDFCAALNSQVAGSSPTGRVTGGGGNAVNNIAFSGMAVSGSGGNNGTGKTSDQIKAAGFFAATGFITPIWDCAEGMLPVLTGFPEGMQSGILPWHIGSPAPSIPRNLTAAHGNTQVTLSWAAPGSEGKSSIIRYEVRKDSDSWISVNMNTTYTFTGLTNGTSYNFQVRAVNSDGDGAEASIQKAPGIAPSDPRNLAAVPDSGQLTLTWSVPSQPGTGGVQFYEVRCAFGTSMPDVVSWVVASGTYSHTFTGMTSGSPYTMQVRAVNNYGIGPSRQITAWAAGRPSAPSGFTAVTGNGQVSLTWGVPASDGSSPITGYEVFHPITSQWISVGTATAYNFTGLGNGTQYTFQVRAVNAVGAGGAATLSAVPRQAPAITSANSTSVVYGDGGSFQVTASGTAPITYSLSGQPSGVSVNGNTGLITIGKTTPVGTHTFTVAAANGQTPGAAQSFTLTVSRRTPVLSDLAYVAPTNYAYNGTAHGVEVLDKNAIGLSIAVYYTGIAGTTYAESQIAPKNAGTYEVTAKIAGSEGWQAAEFALGSYTIIPRSVAVTPVSNQSKEYGQPDPALTYTLSPALVSGDTLVGVLGRAGGEAVGTYPIAMGTLYGGENYTLSLSGAVNFTIIKATQAAPPAPVLAESSYRSITLQTIGGAEYRCGEDGVWQISPVFSGLLPNTPYVFYARLSETGTHRASGVSPASALIYTLELLTQEAPAAPTMLNRTATGVTLNPISGAEYRMGGDGAWQDSNVFTGLTPNEGYTFYARMKETDTHAASAPSGGADLSTEKALLTGAVSIRGDAVFGQQLTADIDGLISDPVVALGVLSYQWQRNGSPIDGAANGEYTLTQSDIGASITVTVASENCNGEIISSATAAVTKAAKETPLVSGELSNDGSTYTYTVTSPASGAEYRMDSGDWQDSNVFAGILPGAGATHTFYARIRETDTHLQSGEGSTGSVGFPKLTPPKPELQYTISGGFPAKMIAISPVEGAEYQFNGSGYGPGNIYSSKDTENIVLSIRIKETDTHTASDAQSVTVSTANWEQPAPEAFALTYMGVGDTHYIVTIPPTEGAEYSFDGVTWSGENTRDCSPGLTVTGYKRIAAIPGYNASPEVLSSVLLPLFQVKTPTASPNGGSFTGRRNVTLTCATAGAEIYYTTDGSTPNAASERYTSPIQFNVTTTINAVAIKAGMTDSTVLTAVFIKRSDSIGGGQAAAPVLPVTGYSHVTAVEGPNGTTRISVSEQAIADAIAQARTAARALGGVNGIAVECNVTMPQGATSLTATLSQNALQRLINAGARSLEINCGSASLSLDLNALKEIRKQSAGSLDITLKQIRGLSSAGKKLIGARPAFDVTVSYVRAGKTVDITRLKSGRATLSIPYKPGKSETAGWLFGVYVDSNGRASRIPGSAYDANTRSILISTDHFSVYGVGYAAPAMKYTDIAAHWARESIDYVAGRGLIDATGNHRFSPDMELDRQTLVIALGRLAGVDVNAYQNSRYIDVAADASYAPYVEWACQKGIISGIGGGKFAPERTVTRQEIALILQNYAKTMGFPLPVTRAAVTFADDSGIGGGYRAAVKAVQRAGIMTGKLNNRFSPKVELTRAEAAAILHRYIKLGIDPATAQGWATDDDGQRRFYKDGMPLAGWQEVGGKWYFFYLDGVLAVNTTIDGHRVDKNGVRVQ